MSTTKILSDRQKSFLELFSSSSLSKNFYLTGGTALTEFYIPYRYSEDLDFFSTVEIPVEEIMILLQSIKSKLGFETIDFNTSFNRNLFFLLFSDEILKTEFTYFPFPRINVSEQKYGVAIDSIEDIAVNKLFTIYQNPRARDYLDLYMIVQKFEYSIHELIKKARIKFDWQIDLIKLGSQFLLAKEIKDYPRLLISLNDVEWQTFFKNEAKKLEKQIFEK